MNTLAAAVLLHLGGKPVDEKGIKDVIVSGGGKADDAQIKKVVEKLKGKDVLKFAKENLGKVSTGGSSGAVAVEAKKEEKKDDKKAADPKKGGDKKVEKKPEPEPEEEDMPMGLF